MVQVVQPVALITMALAAAAVELEVWEEMLLLTA